MDPRVGVVVFVFDPHNPTRFVLGRRKGSHGAGTTRSHTYTHESRLSNSGTIALPGGHLDYGETFEQCAAREVLEETGLIVEEVEFLTATNSVFEASGKHYVTIFMSAKVKLDDEGKTPEPRVSKPLRAGKTDAC